MPKLLAPEGILQVGKNGLFIAFVVQTNDKVGVSIEILGKHCHFILQKLSSIKPMKDSPFSSERKRSNLGGCPI